MTLRPWEPHPDREWRPPRPNKWGIRCARCRLKFIQGGIPEPEPSGRYAGNPLCSRCREAITPGPEPLDLDLRGDD